MTVNELLHRVSAQELTEWMAFYRLEPFGSEANYLGHAITSATVMNSQRTKKSKVFKPETFMPDFERVTEEQTTDEMIAFAEMMTAAFGGKDKRKHE